MPTADESTQSLSRGFAASTAQCHMRSIHCAVQSHKNLPFLTGDINHQSSNWNKGEKKIACNSAYVQIESLSFTFTRQAVIVYFYLCSNIQEITMPNTKYYCTSQLFLPIILDCTLIASKKANEQMFPTIYCP